MDEKTICQTDFKKEKLDTCGLRTTTTLGSGKQEGRERECILMRKKRNMLMCCRTVFFTTP